MANASDDGGGLPGQFERMAAEARARMSAGPPKEPPPPPVASVARLPVQAPQTQVQLPPPQNAGLGQVNPDLQPTSQQTSGPPKNQPIAEPTYSMVENQAMAQTNIANELAAIRRQQSVSIVLLDETREALFALAAVGRRIANAIEVFVDARIGK